LWDTPKLSGGANNNYIDFQNSFGNLGLNASNTNSKVEIENSDLLISGNDSKLLLGNGRGDLPSTCSIVDNYGRSGLQGQVLTFNVEDRTAWEYPKSNIPQITALDVSSNNSLFTIQFITNPSSGSVPTLSIQERGLYTICVSIVGSCTSTLDLSSQAVLVFEYEGTTFSDMTIPSNDINIYDGYNSFAMTIVTTLDTTTTTISDAGFVQANLRFEDRSIANLTKLSLTGTISIFRKN
jgi:hypothetical protein